MMMVIQATSENLKYLRAKNGTKGESVFFILILLLLIFVDSIFFSKIKVLLNFGKLQKHQTFSLYHNPSPGRS